MKNTYTVSTFSNGYKSKFSETRDCLNEILGYISDDSPEPLVCAIYGLRRTGKTILMEQCIERLSDEQKKHTIRIDCTEQADFDEIIDFVNNKIDEGYKYFFIDEITYAKNFQALANIMSNIWVAQRNCKIVVTGTDSLGLSLIHCNSMYDRMKFVNTSYTSFGEYSRITGDSSIDKYIKLGSTLSKTTFGSIKKNQEYILTAIVSNIINSLKKSENLNRYPPVLTEKYSEDALKNEIERIINKYSQSIVYRAVTKQFESSSIGDARQLLTRNNSEGRKAILKLSYDEVNQKIASLLGCEHPSGIGDSDIENIYRFLIDVGVFQDIKVYTSINRAECTDDLGFVSHPGMFHANLKHTFEQLEQDSSWIDATPEERKIVVEKAYQSAMGKIMENVVISDVYHLLRDSIDDEKNSWYVSKISVIINNRRYEADLLICNRDNRDVTLFEIKHSSTNVPHQSSNLENLEFIEYIEENFGRVANKAVLYNGKTDYSTAVPRISASEFLITLYKQSHTPDNGIENVLNVIKTNYEGKSVTDYAQMIIDIPKMAATPYSENITNDIEVDPDENPGE